MCGGERGAVTILRTAELWLNASSAGAAGAVRLQPLCTRAVFSFPTMSVETRCSTCPTWFYSLFTFLNLLLLEHCKWGPPFFPVLDKPLLGRCHSNWDQRWSPAYPPPHTLWSRGVACSSANDNYWYDGFTRHCGPSPWGGTKQPNDRLLSLY